MTLNYSTKTYGENMSRAQGRNLSISTKNSVEICRSLRNKNLQKGKKFLENVISMEEPVPYARYNQDTAHRRGMGPGRYPINAAKEILTILKSAESNAQSKGLNTSKMVIVHINAHKASVPWRYGRQRRRKAKRTHIEVVLSEVEAEQKAEKAPKKEIKK